MKKYLIFIVGFILGIVCTGYASYKLKAEQVSFDKTNIGLNSETVQDGIDELADLLKYGTATASDIKEGKTALVNGEKITGNLTKSGFVAIFKGSTSITMSTYTVPVAEFRTIYGTRNGNTITLTKEGTYRIIATVSHSPSGGSNTSIVHVYQNGKQLGEVVNNYLGYAIYNKSISVTLDSPQNISVNITSDVSKTLIGNRGGTVVIIKES